MCFAYWLRQVRMLHLAAVDFGRGKKHRPSISYQIQLPQAFPVECRITPPAGKLYGVGSCFIFNETVNNPLAQAPKPNYTVFAARFLSKIGVFGAENMTGILVPDFLFLVRSSECTILSKIKISTLLTPFFGNHLFAYYFVLKHSYTNMILSTFCIPKVVKSATKILKIGS